MEKIKPIALRANKGMTRKELADAFEKRGVNMTERKLQEREMGSTKWLAVELVVLMDVFDIKDVNLIDVS